MRGLYISGVDFTEQQDNGGSMASKRNYKAFAKTLDGNVELIMPGRENVVKDGIRYYERVIVKNKIQEIISSKIVNQVYSGMSIKKIIDYAKKNEFDVVWFDGYCGSNIIRALKNSVTTVLFMQNIETQLAWDLWDKRKFWNVFRYNAVRELEKKAVKYADKIITLNSRDNNLLVEKFGKKSDFIFPITIEDKFRDNVSALQPLDTGKKYMLFVGSYYKPNVEAVRWLKKNVMDNIDLKLIVVGKNMEKVRKELETDKIQIAGTVDDITDYYRNAILVIEPIFTGGGMKVKTAEALMYGKNIIGTHEAFVGYDKIDEIDGICLCGNPDEFVSAIKYVSMENKVYNEGARKFFEENYVVEKYLSGLSEVFASEN